MQLDRWLAIAGLVIGLPSFVVLFGTDFAVASMGAALGVVLLGAAFWVHYRASLPPYTFQRVNVHLVINDSGGRQATMTKDYEIRPNFGHLDSLTHRNIAADGSIRNFRWNDRPIEDTDIKTVVGEYVLTIRFPACLPKFKVFRGKLSYDAVDTFLGSSEAMIWRWSSCLPA